MGTVTPTTDLSTPACSILAIRRGRAVSEELVAKMSRYSRPRYFMRDRMLRPVTTFRTVPSTTTMKAMQVR